MHAVFCLVRVCEFVICRRAISLNVGHLISRQWVGGPTWNFGEERKGTGPVASKTNGKKEHGLQFKWQKKLLSRIPCIYHIEYVFFWR